MAKQEIEMHGSAARKELGQHITYAKSLIARHKDLVESEEIDEMDFGSIGKTLSKYGKGVPKDDPKKVSRSTVHTDYTMTGHKEKKSGTGRVYTKVLADYDDDAGKAAKATQAPDQVEAPKRGRGRPAGAVNKNGSGVTGKGWSAEAKASMKAKLAANKAAKLAAAAKNESEELEESFAVVDHKGKQVHVAYSESSAKKKAEELSKSTGNAHTVKFVRTATVKESELDEAFTQHAVKAYFAAAGQKSISPHEFVKKVGADKATEHLHAIRGEAAKNGSTKFNVQHDRIVKGLQAAVINAKWGIKQESITEEDWADITEGQSLDAIVEFMMDEEYQSLDELSKSTLGSYIKKSSSDAASLATNAMHLKNTANMHADASREAEKRGDQLTAVKRDQQASDYHDHSFKASHKQYKRLVGVRKATDRLTKESTELEEVKKDSFGMPSHHIDKVKQKIRDGVWEPQTDLKANAHVEIRHTKTGKRETIHVHESVELDEAHDGTFKEGDVVSVDYHDISGKSHHGKANVHKATKGFVHVQHPSVNGLTLKFHQTVNGKTTANEVGTLPGTRAGGHRITKLGTNESEELDEAHKPGSVGISVNPGGSDLGKAGKKYTVFFHPEANSPRGRTKAVDISHHEDVDSAKAAKAAYVEKHKAHGVVALRGMGESIEIAESTEDLNIQRYAALIGKNLIKE